MAMMISKFHKLIQSRILWIGFLVVIVFSFVVWGMVWPSDLDEMEQANAAGTLDGQPVSHSEFRSAYLGAFMARALSSGRDIPSTPENEAALRRLSWQRLATLRQAANLGIAVADDELVSAIRGSFADENKTYNPQQYRAFIANVLRPMGFSETQFEQHVREEIAIQKLGSLVGRQAHVTPLEVRRTYATLLDSFTVEYALASLADAEAQTRVDDDDARAFFDQDPEAFTLPEMREVLYAAFPVADYLDPQAEFSDDEILDYYELNMAKYTTNEEGDDGQTRTTVADLDDVRDDVLSSLRFDSALVQADDAAAALVVAAIPGSDGALPDFEAVARQAGRTVQALPAFSRTEAPLDDAGPAFASAVFALELGAFDRVSAPVVGEENVYVAYLSKIHPPRVPEFDEVQERALRAARRKAVVDALVAKADALRADAQAALAAGESFADAAARHDLAVQTLPPFTGLSGSSSEDPVVQALVQAVVAYNQGEVVEPLPTPDGSIVAHVLRREPADPETFDSYRDEIADAIRGRRAQGLFADWQAALLSPARFTDLQRQALPDDEDFDDETGDEAPAPGDDA
jgi:peptidyl-prolyl cis-trans isomerase D